MNHSHDRDCGCWSCIKTALSDEREAQQRLGLVINPEQVGVNLFPLILRCRFDVCAAFVDLPLAALDELAIASEKLALFVACGMLTAPAAYDPLQEVAENLGLVNRFGQDVVQAAIAYGPRLWLELEADVGAAITSKEAA